MRRTEIKHITIKHYPTYQTYLDEQSSKLNQGIDWIDSYENMYQPLLTDLIRRLQQVVPTLTQSNQQVLCLGARRGAEVRAFRSLGFDCVGVDINPGPNNELVMQGDFHNLDSLMPLQDIVYTNSLDHILDPDKFLNGVRKVLKPGGYFLILRASVGVVYLDRFASFSWDNFDEVIKLISEYGFTHKGRINIEGNNFFEALELLRRTGI